MKKLLDYATGMFIFPLSFRQLDLRYGYKVQNKTEVELEIPVSFRLDKTLPVRSPAVSCTVREVRGVRFGMDFRRQ